MSADDSCEEIWLEAVAKYEKSTNRKLAEDSAFSKVQTVEDLQNEVKNEEQRFKGFRTEHHKVYSALAKCFRPIQDLVKLVQAGLGSTPYAPAAIVLGAASNLIKASSEVSKAYDALEELFQRIGDVTVRLQEYTIEKMEASLKAKMTDVLACLLGVIGKSETLIKRCRFKQLARTIFLHDSDIQESLKTLESYINSEFGLVIALTYGRVGKLQDTAAEINNKVDVLSASHDNDRRRAISEAEEKTLSEALYTKAAAIVAAKYADNLDRLTKGTGLWITDEAMFRAWEQEKAPILWIFGKPGTGKTFLATRIIDVLKNKYPQHVEHASLTSISYFYIKEDPDLQDMNQILKTIAAQITKVESRYQKFAAHIIKDPDKIVTARLTWENLFLDYFTEGISADTTGSLAFIIIDGLDEAPEGEIVKLLLCLKKLVERTGLKRCCRIQLAVFARPEVRGYPGFEDVGFQIQGKSITVTPARNQEDIKKYIRQRLEQIAVLKKLKLATTRQGVRRYHTVTKQINQSIQTRSNGMFLWAKLVFDQIDRLPSPEAIAKALEKAPPGLDDMIHHVFKRLGSEEQAGPKYLNELLTWVTCAYRSLSLAELYVILIVTTGQHCYVLDDDLKGKYSTVFELVGPAEAAFEDNGSIQLENSSDAFSFLDVTDEDEQEASESKDDCEESSVEGDNVLHSESEDLEPADSKSLNENDNPLYYSTTVSFSHARIRDYLVSEGIPNTKRFYDCTVGIENLNTAHFRMALTCVRILCSSTAKDYDTGSLGLYAGTYFMFHLAEVDLTSILQKEKNEMARHLYILFSGEFLLLESSDGNVDHFIRNWFGTQRYSDIVRGLLSQGHDEFSTEEQDWVDGAISSARELFRPMALSCAKRWLIKTGWDDEAYLDKSEQEVRILYAYDALVEEGEGVSSLPLVDVDESPWWSASLEQLEKLAEFGSIQKTTHWYTGLAWILMECDHTDAAIENFRKALDMSPQGWVAMEGLARCYGDDLQDFDSAIPWMYKAIESVPSIPEFEGLELYFYPRISNWKSELQDNEGAMDAARTAYQAGKSYLYGTGSASDFSILSSIKHYISAMFAADRLRDIVDLLYELDRTLTYDSSSLLSKFLLASNDGFYDISMFEKLDKIIRSTKDTDFTDFVEAAADRAIHVVRDNEDIESYISLAKKVAIWKYQHGTRPENSAMMWESIVAKIDQSPEMSQAMHSQNRSEAAAALGEVYFSEAVTAFGGGADFKTPVSKLQKLAMHSQGGLQFYRAAYPATILAFWLREYEHVEEDVWRASLRPAMKKALYMLNDDDPWNDQSGYAQLGATLLQAGDTLNASIALGITTRPLEELKERDATLDNELQVDYEAVGVQSEENETEPIFEAVATNPQGQTGIAQPELNTADKLTQSLIKDEEIAINPKMAGFTCMWTCDGPCTEPDKAYEELHFCQICYDTCFCSTCAELVKKDQLPFRKCSANHPLVRIYPITPEAREMTDALLNRDFDRQQKWLDGLRDTWGVVLN